MKILLPILILLLCSSAFGATYRGRDLDDEQYKAEVYSRASNEYFIVEVSFDDDECTISFPHGGELVVTMDDEEIDDPHAISTYDFDKSAYWDVDLTNFD